uniref:Uncharacterized protein n=1 Tax=Glossina austeni TaxID=7395 RepID=A0A1A9UND8_GLOAU
MVMKRVLSHIAQAGLGWAVHLFGKHFRPLYTVALFTFIITKVLSGVLVAPNLCLNAQIPTNSYDKLQNRTNTVSYKPHRTKRKMQSNNNNDNNDNNNDNNNRTTKK